MQNSHQYHQLFLGKLPNLSKNQRKVAEYLIEHPQEMALSSITDIAKHLNVSQATIVRLAKTLGFKGYLEMKSEMIEHLRQNLNPIERFQLEIDQPHPEDDFFSIIALQEINNIKNTLQIVDRVYLTKAIELLVDSDHIYTMGLGISAFIAQVSAYLLNRVTLKSSSLFHGSVSFFEQIIGMKKSDVIIAFSLQPYSSGTIDAVKFAQKEGIKIIAVTDQIISPITQYSDVTLLSKTENKLFANSIIATAVLIYSLATEVAFKNREKTKHALSQLEYVRTDFMLVEEIESQKQKKKFF